MLRNAPNVRLLGQSGARGGCVVDVRRENVVAPREGTVRGHGRQNRTAGYVGAGHRGARGGGGVERETVPPGPHARAVCGRVAETVGEERNVLQPAGKVFMFRGGGAAARAVFVYETVRAFRDDGFDTALLRVEVLRTKKHAPTFVDDT